MCLSSCMPICTRKRCLGKMHTTSRPRLKMLISISLGESIWKTLTSCHLSSCTTGKQGSHSSSNRITTIDTFRFSCNRLLLVQHTSHKNGSWITNLQHSKKRGCAQNMTLIRCHPSTQSWVVLETQTSLFYASTTWRTSNCKMTNTTQLCTRV